MFQGTRRREPAWLLEKGLPFKLNGRCSMNSAVLLSTGADGKGGLPSMDRRPEDRAGAGTAPIRQDGIDVAAADAYDPTETKVLLIDSQKLFAEAIVLALSGREFDLLPVTATAAEGVDAALRNCPDLVLIDLQLLDGSGIKAGVQILGRCRKIKIVALTDLRDADILTEAIRSGFHGYLTKDVSLAYFLEAIKIVLDGGAVIPQTLAAAAAGASSPDEQAARLLKEQLTARELAILRLLVEGGNGRAMARELSISPNTVRTHVQNILTKLQVHSRLEAVALAIRHGLVEPADSGRAAAQEPKT